MKYFLAIGLMVVALVASYKGWIAKCVTFFKMLSEKAPADNDNLKMMYQDGNDFQVCKTSNGKLQLFFDDLPKGMKTLKILADNYRRVTDSQYIQR